jgi:penicillin-binding protein 2
MEVRFPEDDRLPGWKIAVFQYVIAGTFLFLLLGYWRLQIGHHSEYLEQAERNRTRNLPVIAPRGRILDRYGRVLADNFPAFSVLLMRETPASLTREHIAGIAKGLYLDPDEVQKLVERTAHLPRFQPVLLKQAATLGDISFVESHLVEYPELDLIQVQERKYPYHAAAAQMLGYVGEVSEEAMDEPGSHYRPGDVVGKFGIEREYDSVLAGRDGMRRVMVNSRGQEVGSLTTINALAGNDLRLTIDLDIQMAAETALGDRAGAVVALDPATGEVLAMVSHPAFDPNDFAHRIDSQTWKQLTSDPMKPMMNKAIQTHLAPGSVFKIITATAALETGAIKPDFTVHCAGEVDIYGHMYHDWVWEKHRGHGVVNLTRAIAESCDVYFYTLGKMLGIDKIAYFAQHLGLGEETGVDLPGESAGLVPSPAWVQRIFKRKWWAGETIPVAIGQGALAVTPLQLAYAVGGILMDGHFYRPHLAFRDQLLALGVDPPANNERIFPLKPQSVAAVTDGMWNVVNGPGGTGADARCPGINIAGKTGTAQVVSAELQNANKGNSAYRNNAWFVGFSPVDKPEIVVAALVLQGEHSTVAVPVVRDVIKAYFDKKWGHAPPLQPPGQSPLLSNVTRPGQDGASAKGQ